jgi:hypothetical protein
MDKNIKIKLRKLIDHDQWYYGDSKDLTQLIDKIEKLLEENNNEKPKNPTAYL